MQCSKSPVNAAIYAKTHIKKSPNRKRKRLGAWADLGGGSLSGGRSGWGHQDRPTSWQRSTSWGRQYEGLAVFEGSRRRNRQAMIDQAMTDSRERSKETRERKFSRERSKWRERSSRRERLVTGPSQPGVRPSAITQVTSAIPTIVSIMANFLQALGPRTAMPTKWIRFLWKSCEPKLRDGMVRRPRQAGDRSDKAVIPDLHFRTIS